MIAQEVVRTTGVNWESIAVIGGFVIAAMTFVLTQMSRRNTQIKNDITASVDNLGEKLMLKLETKESVQRISERLIVVETTLKDIHDNPSN